MLLYSSPEPDPCCVWSRAEKPSLCPAGPDLSPGLCHRFGLSTSSSKALVYLYLSQLFPSTTVKEILSCIVSKKRCAGESCAGLAGW